VQKGDLAVIDFFGYVDGETFKGGKGINYTVEVGAGTMIPGFEDALVGANVSEQKEFTAVVPEDAMGPEEVRGKTVEWKVDVKEIKHKILPELDDEFAKDLGEYDTLDRAEGARSSENLATRNDAKSQAAAPRQVHREAGRDQPGRRAARHGRAPARLPAPGCDADGRAEQGSRRSRRRSSACATRTRGPRQEAGRGDAACSRPIVREEKLEVTEAELEGRLDARSPGRTG
jgi:hypothetical protein